MFAAKFNASSMKRWDTRLKGQKEAVSSRQKGKNEKRRKTKRKENRAKNKMKLEAFSQKGHNKKSNKECSV